MNSGYVNPSIFNQTPDELEYGDYIHTSDNVEGPFFGDNSFMNFNPPIPTLPSYQDAEVMAQQQFLDSIPVDDVSNESLTAQLKNQYDAATAFPFPAQGAPQTFGTPSTAPSTMISPESSPQNNDSPSSNNTTSPEANAHPTKPPPKKRGRKPRVVKSKAEEEELRQKFLERNRIAASKCREKKRGENDKMQNDVHALKFKNDQLKDEVAFLRNQVEELKMVLEPHLTAKCGDNPSALAILGRRDKKLATRQRASTQEPLDLDGMSYETESEEVKTRQISVDSGVADLSTPTQPMSTNPFSA